MLAWRMIAVAFLVCMAGCGALCLHGDPLSRLVGLEVASLVACMTLQALAVLFERGSFTDVALALAIFSFGGGLVFARFFERWL